VGAGSYLGREVFLSLDNEICYNFCMSLDHTLTLSKETWLKLKQAADERNLAVHELIETFLEDKLDITLPSTSKRVNQDKVVRIVPMDQVEKPSVYWRTKPVADRLAALEEIRREYHQWKYDSQPRLQRVYTIVKQESG